MKRWIYNPHGGGKTIPQAVRQRVHARLRAFAERRYGGRYRELDVRFRGQFCYVDCFVDADVPEGWPPPGSAETRDQMIARLESTPLHLARLRYFGDEERWSFAFYSYASERYEASVFASGEWHGPPEEAFDLAASVHLQ